MITLLYTSYNTLLLFGSRKYPYFEEIGNFIVVEGGGGWGSKAQEFTDRRGMISGITFPDGQCKFDAVH